VETPPAGLREAGAEAYRVLRDTVAEGIAAGALRPGDADQLSLAAWSLVHGLGMLIVEGQLPDTRSPARVKAVTDGMVTLLEVGLRRVR
jgi:hypothetical protein